MTKTCTEVVPYRFAKFVLPEIIAFSTNVDRSFVWNFEFGSLVFGAWNFHDFHLSNNFVKLSQMYAYMT